jgi:hypothetical protein
LPAPTRPARRAPWRTGRRRWPCLPVALLLLALAAGRAGAQQAEQARLGEARAEEQRLAAERVAAAARLRGLEDTTLAAASRVADLAQRQREAEARLEQASAKLAPMLPVVERMALYPAETLLAVPLPPEQAVRGLLVLGAIGRQLEADAAVVRAGQAGSGAKSLHVGRVADIAPTLVALLGLPRPADMTGRPLTDD